MTQNLLILKNYINQKIILLQNCYLIRTVKRRKSYKHYFAISNTSSFESFKTISPRIHGYCSEKFLFECSLLLRKSLFGVIKSAEQVSHKSAYYGILFLHTIWAYFPTLTFMALVITISFSWYMENIADGFGT